MNLICPLRTLLDPLIERTSFVLDDAQEFVDDQGRTHRVLEYHGTLSDGRMVLLGFYQHSGPRIMTAEMWVPDDATRMFLETGRESVARRRRVWSYNAATDPQSLARAIVTEVATWLLPSGPSCELDVRGD
jgi:hypothetical protein